MVVDLLESGSYILRGLGGNPSSGGHASDVRLDVCVQLGSSKFMSERVLEVMTKLQVQASPVSPACPAPSGSRGRGCSAPAAAGSSACC